MFHGYPLFTKPLRALIFNKYVKQAQTVKMMLQKKYKNNKIKVIIKTRLFMLLKLFNAAMPEIVILRRCQKKQSS